MMSRSDGPQLARMESVRRELKMNHISTTYPNMIELYEITSMVVTHMVDVERKTKVDGC